MHQSGLDIVHQIGWLLLGIVDVVLLVIFIEVYEVGIATVIVMMLPLGAVVGKVPSLSALEACIISHVAWGFLGIGYMSSNCISSSTPPIVRGMGSVDIHRDWLVIHPLQCVGGVVLGSLLSLFSSSLSEPLVIVPSSSSVL